MFAVTFSLIILISSLTMSSCENSDYFAPSLFLNHGGGPYPVLGERDNLEIAESLRNVSQIVDLKRLNAIIVVTAHREENIVIISSGNRHNLLFDYYNFPPESYQFKYSAPGSPDLARKIHDAFKKEGIPSQLDAERGWDHGVFIPMMLINPNADIPIIQVSILRNQDAKQHFDMGKVLYQFRKDGVAVFGSGMSYHNMKEFVKALKFSHDDVVLNEHFDKFLTEVCTGDLNKRQELILWDKAEEGLESHPLGKAEHLMPLIVNAGAGGSQPGRKVFETFFIQKFKLSGFIWDKE